MNGFALLLGFHILAGSTALLSLAVPFLSRWGGRVHRRSGWVFSVSMAGVALSAWLLCALRLLDGAPENDRDALFLAHVGLLSATSVWCGLRAARLKRHKERRTWLDLVWPGALVLASFFLGASGVRNGDALWMVFSVIGVLSGYAPLKYFLSPASPEREWMVQHLSSMGGGAIAAVTAFFVVNIEALGLSEYALVFWIAPGVLGSVLLGRLTARVRQGAAQFGSSRGESPRSRRAVEI